MTIVVLVMIITVSSSEMVCIMMRAPLLGWIYSHRKLGVLDRDRGNYGWQSESKVRRVDNINVEIVWQAVPVSENEAYCTCEKRAR